MKFRLSDELLLMLCGLRIRSICIEAVRRSLRKGLTLRLGWRGIRNLLMRCVCLTCMLEIVH